jgi:hypothetical protein
MTQDQIRAILERVSTWPRDRQEEAAEMLLLLEGREGEVYRPSADEWAAIQEGLEQIERGDLVPDDEVEALLRQLAT